MSYCVPVSSTVDPRQSCVCNHCWVCGCVFSANQSLGRPCQRDVGSSLGHSVPQYCILVHTCTCTCVHLHVCVHLEIVFTVSLGYLMCCVLMWECKHLIIRILLSCRGGRALRRVPLFSPGSHGGGSMGMLWFSTYMYVLHPYRGTCIIHAHMTLSPPPPSPLCSLIWHGWRKSLVYDDLSDLNEEDKAKKLAPQFQENWDRELKRAG